MHEQIFTEELEREVREIVRAEIKRIYLDTFSEFYSVPESKMIEIFYQESQIVLESIRNHQ